MNKTIIRKIARLFAFGGIAALFSTIAVGLACCAVWLFCYIPAASGYFAVLLFALALLATAAALYLVYMCGAWIYGTGKFSK
jgi:hypothetical protein